MFGLEDTRIGSSEGVCDWKHLGDYLKSHESSRLHKDSSHNLSFRGRKEKLISDSDSSETSGNFIDLVKLIAQFDPMLRLHLKQDLAENTTDCQLVSECHSMEKKITTYEFVVALVVWYDILTKINVISKMWQSEKMHLDAAIQHLEAFTHWLDNYRENGFQSSLKVQSPRRRRKITNFDDREDEALELPAEEIFKINYFYVIVDNVRASCQPRFEALKHHESIFGFMYNIKRLKEICDCELLKQCSDSQISLTVGETSDIDGHERTEYVYPCI
ncbi:uncharacterized protein [Centruroides vittatus]|uniref:uncharacterized protein n=1 Tax=Centruroides vittatus TaxID=120091 RepID=UPI0035108BAD